MSKGSDLSAAIEAKLSLIKAVNGYTTDIAGVYGFSQPKKDSAPCPYLLVRVAEDSGSERSGSKVKRLAIYEVQGVFSRTATLQDLQRCNHDILRSLGYGDLPPGRELIQGEIVEESAEFDPDTSGSTTRSVISRLTIQYVEAY